MKLGLSGYGVKPRFVRSNANISYNPTFSLGKKFGRRNARHLCEKDEPTLDHSGGGGARQGWGQVQYLYLVLVLKYIFISTWCTWVLGVWKCQSTCTCTCTWPKSTWYLQVIFKYYLLKSVKIANYLNTLL